MNIQIFGTNKNFDTKKAQRFFKERGVKFQMIDLKEKGMSNGELTSVARAVGGWESLLDRDAKDNDAVQRILWSPEELRPAMLQERPQCLRQPIVRNGRQATIGYCPEIWKTWE